MIELSGLTPAQCIIAETLWNRCQTQADVQDVLYHYGQPAQVVYELMLAHAMDQLPDTDLAAEYLQRFSV